MEVKRVFAKLAKSYELRCCYETSGVGFALHRWLNDIGVSCEVVASSLIPVKASDRVKTDKRDALKLARLYRAGQLTAVHVPSEKEECVRSLVRLRESLVREVTESKNNISAFLTRHGISWPEKSRWTQKHWAWLRQQTFAAPEDYVWAELIAMLEYKMARLNETERRITEYAQTEVYREKVGKLCCFRGVAIVTAMTLITELFDFDRFKSARAMMAYLGLAPAEHSSGESRKQSGITKTGNSRCRRVIVEASWKCRPKPRMSKALTKRQENQPAWVVAHCWKAQQRLSKKFAAIAYRKPSQVAAVAVARELVGFIWAVMTDNVATA